MTYQQGTTDDTAKRRTVWSAKLPLSFLGAFLFLIAGACEVTRHLIIKKNQQGLFRGVSTNRRNLIDADELLALAKRISGEAALNDEYSPASMAYKRLISTKQNKKGVLAERYCLTVLYYSLGGSRMMELNVATLPDLVVLPEGSNSTGVVLPEDSNSTGTRRLVSEEFNWVQKNKQRHCRWQGITCDENNRVTKIYLSGLALSGSLPQGNELAQFENLEMLYLGENEITGGLPENLFQVTSLKHLYLQNNSLSGTVPLNLGNLVNLVGIYMGDNNFVGSIPTSVVNLRYLRKSDKLWRPIKKKVALESYQFCSLSIWYYVLCITEYFSMLRNNLSGLIPRFSNKLALLDLGWNDFAGPLPVHLSYNSALHFLYLNNNRFTGSVPYAWKSFAGKRLETFHVNDNLLSGTFTHIFNSEWACT
jgi:Leucine-rich repeat (LRR) protein